jgi:ABC-2 type transport system ATP-binding protein
MNLIETHELGKTYNNHIALQHINWKVDHKGIFIIVGPNGAGKTTLLRILGAQLLPTKGKAEVMGFDVVKEAEKVRNVIAMLPQEAIVDVNLTPYEHIRWFLVARGCGLKEAKESAEETLRSLDLWEIRNKVTGQLSGGLRQRTLIAMLIATRAPILFLDEPTVGLDPISRRKTWDLLIKLTKSMGITIIITTHYMEEAEALAEKVTLLNEGKILASGSVSELKSMVKEKIRIVIEGDVDMSLLNMADDIKTYGKKIILYLRDYSFYEEVTRLLLEKKITFNTSPISLEDVFIKVIENGKKN